jgi:hypothetical protein
MNSGSYEPKELLATLMEIEEKLRILIDTYCPDKTLSLSGDLDTALNNFLQLQHVPNNEIGFLSSQLALFHLKKEVERARNVVIDSNNLRAFHDYSTYLINNVEQKKIERRRSFVYLILGAFLGGILFTVLFLLII